MPAATSQDAELKWAQRMYSQFRSFADFHKLDEAYQ